MKSTYEEGVEKLKLSKKRIEIFCSDETKFQVINKKREKALDTYENINTIDGIKIVFPDSWALIRASNTSLIMRLSIEARNQKRLNELKREVTKLIKSVDAKY